LDASMDLAVLNLPDPHLVAAASPVKNAHG